MRLRTRGTNLVPFPGDRVAWRPEFEKFVTADMTTRTAPSSEGVDRRSWARATLTSRCKSRHPINFTAPADLNVNKVTALSASLPQEAALMMNFETQYHERDLIAAAVHTNVCYGYGS